MQQEASRRAAVEDRVVFVDKTSKRDTAPRGGPTWRLLPRFFRTAKAKLAALGELAPSQRRKKRRGPGLGAFCSGIKPQWYARLQNSLAGTPDARLRAGRGGGRPVPHRHPD